MVQYHSGTNSAYFVCGTLKSGLQFAYPSARYAWAVLSFGGPMWSSKKPDSPQTAQPEPKNLTMNQPPKPAPATWEGTNSMSTDAMRPRSEERRVGKEGRS